MFLLLFRLPCFFKFTLLFTAGTSGTTHKKMTTTTEKTNDLRHSILAHDEHGNPMYIKIRLSDECKNGHQDFSITGDIYEKGKPKIDRYFISGGCIHDAILKARPDLKPFIDLHLCDYDGIPMHPIANGYYFLRNGFNNTRIDDPKFKAEYCDYFRITPQQFDELNTAKNRVQFAFTIEKLGIPKQWKADAVRAIDLLTKWTGKEFENDSSRNNWIPLTDKEIEEEAERQKTGFYTPQAEAERVEAKRQSVINALIADRDKEISKANEEFDVKIEVFRVGGGVALNNCIFYNHTKTLAFNWRSYDRIGNELIDKLRAEMILPSGVTIEDKGK